MEKRLRRNEVEGAEVSTEDAVFGERVWLPFRSRYAGNNRRSTKNTLSRGEFERMHGLKGLIGLRGRAKRLLTFKKKSKASSSSMNSSW